MYALPDPITNDVSLWLKNLHIADLHGTGWRQVNRDFHGIAMAMRPFLQQHYPDPGQRAAAFDGFVAGLLTLGHFQDVADLSELFTAPASTEEAEICLPQPHKAD